ncbi:hypothetical protein Ahy_B08g091220 isoform I [Arachis hypogaea]|uniref:Uncharacterized protein n=1 Tax=Arachis hypogaea TaxID=3818 RepID=A0A444Y1T8_ARAHY|nr:hypothetical protein Ahy_B08g091220 isoform I [Arachis hypogaea]
MGVFNKTLSQRRIMSFSVHLFPCDAQQGFYMLPCFYFRSSSFIHVTLNPLGNIASGILTLKGGKWEKKIRI